MGIMCNIICRDAWGVLLIGTIAIVVLGDGTPIRARKMFRAVKVHNNKADANSPSPQKGQTRASDYKALVSLGASK